MSPGSDTLNGEHRTMSRARKSSATPRRKRAVGRLKPGRLQRALEQAERTEIAAALKETAGNVTHAAKALGISRRGLWLRMAALSIDPSTYRA